MKVIAFQASGYATDLLIAKTHLMKWIVFAPMITFNVVDAIKAVDVMEKHGLICMNAFHSKTTAENRLVISVTTSKSENIFAFFL